MGGVGVITPLLTTLILLPALLAHPRLTWFQHKIATPVPSDAPRRWKLPEFVVRVPILFVTIGLLAGGTMAWQGRTIHWSFDYASMLDPELPSVAAWKELTERTTHSTEVVALVARGLDEAGDYTAKLEATESVARVEGITGYLPPDQAAKLRILAALAPTLEPPAEGVRTPDAISRDALVSSVESVLDTLVDVRFEAVLQPIVA